MSHRIKFLDNAKSDMSCIEEHLSQYYPNTARKFFEKMEKKISNLEENHYMYPAYEADPFFRKIAIENYLLFYSVDDELSLVSIHRIIHSKRDISADMLENALPEKSSL